MLLFAIYLVLVFFSLAQIRVLVVIGLYFIQRRRKRNLSNPSLPPSDIVWPSVVVQLPVYREHKVLDRLLSSIVQMEYPKGLMSVQVIDDSEEHEANLAREIVVRYREGPVRVEYLHRTHRTGYKAGALNYGNQQAKCDLVAIFDADFIPRPDFLLKTVPLFQNEKVGAVQTRWSHLNDLESPLTMLQAAVLDSFFCFENPIRQSMGESGIFIGTSGVWRRSTIDDIGGWREGLLGEDINLSYRAQTSGWFIAFLDEPLSSGELPDTYLVYKSQQRRWARGMSQALLDHWQQAFKLQRGIGIRFLELSMLYLQLSMPCLLLLALLTGLYIGLGLPRSPLWLAAQVFLFVVLILFPPIIELLLTQKLLYRDWQRRCMLVLRAVPPGIGVSLTILAGYLDTIRHSKTEFVRTPKQSSDTVIQSSKRQWIQSSAQIAALEVLVGILTLIAFILAVIRGYIESWFLLLSLSGAFLIAGCTSWWELSQNLIRRAER